MRLRWRFCGSGGECLFSNDSAFWSHLSDMRLHAFLFSRSCVSLAIRSHSAANFLNSSDRFIGCPSPSPVPDIPNFSQSQMCQNQTIVEVTAVRQLIE